MKSLTILAITYLFLGSNLTCKDFYTGSFELASVDKTTHKIIRTDTKQIEILESKGTETEFDIKWLDECKYMLFNRRVIKGVDNDPANKDTLYNQISNMDERSCKVTSWFKWSTKMECTMVKTK